MIFPAFNSVAWFELGTDQPEQVKQFYGELFDWKYFPNTNTPGVTYHSVMTPGAQQPTGGVWESEGAIPQLRDLLRPRPGRRRDRRARRETGRRCAHGAGL